jgi:hypothetical protein
MQDDEGGFLHKENKPHIRSTLEYYTKIQYP